MHPAWTDRHRVVCSGSVCPIRAGVLTLQNTWTRLRRPGGLHGCPRVHMLRVSGHETVGWRAQAMFAARVISDIAGRISPKTAWIQTQPGARARVPWALDLGPQVSDIA